LDFEAGNYPADFAHRARMTGIGGFQRILFLELSGMGFS
jgi:hypothetical protein